MMFWFTGVRPAVSPAALAPREPAVLVPPAELATPFPADECRPGSPAAACGSEVRDAADGAPPPAHAVRSRQPASRMAPPSAQRRGLTMLVMHVGRRGRAHGSGGC